MNSGIDSALRALIREEIRAELAPILGRLEGLDGVDATAPKWFTVKSAAAYANRHHDTIRKACQSGLLPATQRVKGGSWSIQRSDLDAWLSVDTNAP